MLCVLFRACATSASAAKLATAACFSRRSLTPQNPGGRWHTLCSRLCRTANVLPPKSRRAVYSRRPSGVLGMSDTDAVLLPFSSRALHVAATSRAPFNGRMSAIWPLLNAVSTWVLLAAPLLASFPDGASTCVCVASLWGEGYGESLARNALVCSPDQSVGSYCR